MKGKKMEELTYNTYNELFQALRVQVEKIFDYPHYQKDWDVITDFLIHQGVDDVSSETIAKIEDYRSESCEEHMFNWIHCGTDESPFEIKNAPCVEDMGNVLILEDGFCIFWYDIGVDKEPYSPYEKDDFELD